MFPKCVEKLACILAAGLRLNKARAKCLAGIVIGATEAKSVLLAKLATRVPGNATTTSKFRRLQDFFREVLLDFDAVAILLMGFVADLTKEPLTLALDRTNWKTRGNDVNLLVPSVCLDDTGLPILWIDLRMAGNSDTSYRLGLIRQFVELFGTENIHVLVGDREFIGQEWFAGLMKEGVVACIGGAEWDTDESESYRGRTWRGGTPPDDIRPTLRNRELDAVRDHALENQPANASPASMTGRFKRNLPACDNGRRTRRRRSGTSWKRCAAASSTRNPVRNRRRGMSSVSAPTSRRRNRKRSAAARRSGFSFSARKSAKSATNASPKRREGRNAASGTRKCLW